jgi:hypothetical protein
MEPEGSLPLSQEPSTDPYPEPDQSSQHKPNLSLQDPSSYYSPTYILVFIVVYNHTYSFIKLQNITKYTHILQ